MRPGTAFVSERVNEGGHFYLSVFAAQRASALSRFLNGEFIHALDL